MKHFAVSLCKWRVTDDTRERESEHIIKFVSAESGEAARKSCHEFVDDWITSDGRGSWQGSVASREME